MKSIFISGASRGIGLAIAQRFHSAGWQVGICARGQAGVEAAVKSMPGCKGFVGDLSAKAEAQRIAAEVKAAMGTLDVLVNNSGIFVPGVMHEEEDSVFENLIPTNLHSAYYLTKGLLPDMKAKGAGTIVNLCSIASVRAYPAGGSYAVSKHALLGFSRSLREELKPHGIRVVSVLPGATWTSSWEGAGVPEDRMMPAEDIAELIHCSVMLSPRTVVEEILVRPQLGDL